MTGGVPAFLPPLSTKTLRPTRLDLARWLFDPANPLTARVTVNRMWQHFFGMGLVDTENDFGMQGSPPTHPELLDWLSSEFEHRGWSRKSLHRLIVTSATYRQSSFLRDDLRERDPNNRLLARQSRVRLEAETVRDAALGRQRPVVRQARRPQRLSTAARRHFRGDAAEKGLARKQRPRPLPSRHVHSFFAQQPVSHAADLRRPGRQHHLHPPRPLQHAFAGPHAGQRPRLHGNGRSPRRPHPPRSANDTDSRLHHAFEVCLSREPSPLEEARLADFIAHHARPSTRRTWGRPEAGRPQPPGRPLTPTLSRGERAENNPRPLGEGGRRPGEGTSATRSKNSPPGPPAGGC